MKKSDITREKILTSAEAEFAQKGLHGARIDEIALGAGINKRMIYAYFVNKETLYMTVLGIVYGRLTECEEVLLNSTKSGIEAIREIVLLYFDFLSRDPSFVKLVMWENLNEARYIEKSDAPILKEPMLKAAGKLIQKGIDDGVFRAETDVYQTVLSLNMFCFSYFSNIYTMGHLLHNELQSKTEIKKRAAYICDITLAYLKKI